MGCVVNVTPWPLYPGRETRYQLYRKLGGPQGRSGHQEQGRAENTVTGGAVQSLGDLHTVG